MQHLWREEQHSSTQHLLTIEDHKQSNFIRETTIQKYQFLCRMHRTNTIFLRQVCVQHLPESSKVCALPHLQSLSLCFPDTRATGFCKGQTTLRDDGVVLCSRMAYNTSLYGVSLRNALGEKFIYNDFGNDGYVYQKKI